MSGTTSWMWNAECVEWPDGPPLGGCGVAELRNPALVICAAANSRTDFFEFLPFWVEFKLDYLFENRISSSHLSVKEVEQSTVS